MVHSEGADQRFNLGLGTSCPQHLSESKRPFKKLSLIAEHLPSTLGICVEDDFQGDFMDLPGCDESETLSAVTDSDSWRLLGFDVANRFLTSAVSNELNAKKLTKEMAKLFVETDSVTKLFDSLSIATEFCNLANSTFTPRWRWYVMSIYLLKDELDANG